MFSAYMTMQWVTCNIISFLSRRPCVSFTEGPFFLGDESLMGGNVLKLHQVEQLWECIMDNVLIIIFYHTSDSR